MNLILFGFKGVGKTTFGKRLSHLLNRPFIDTDQCLYPGPISDLYEQIGEDAFRLLEKKVILSLTKDLNAVIALGGGSILDPENCAHLQKIGKLIYLKQSFDTLQKRILKKSVPSFVDPQDPIKSLQKIYEERLPLYEKIPALQLTMEEDGL